MRLFFTSLLMIIALLVSHVAIADGRVVMTSASSISQTNIASSDLKTKKITKYINRKALVIGNANYKDQVPLKNPINDAQSIAKKLAEVGFEVTYEEDLSYREFGRALVNFQKNLSDTDMSLFYFAGHGIEINNQNYLIPVDAELRSPEDVEFEAVTLDKAIYAAMETGKLSMILIDACRNNPFVAKMDGNKRSISRGLSVVEVPSQGFNKYQIISFAASSGQVADDGLGVNSPYATALLDLLDEPNLEVGKMFRLLGDKVSDMTGGKQQPSKRDNLRGEDIYLVEGDSAVTEIIKDQSASLQPVAVTSKTESLVKDVATYQKILEIEDLALRLDVLKSFILENPESFLRDKAQKAYLEPLSTTNKINLDDLIYLNARLRLSNQSFVLHEKILSAEHSSYLADMNNRYLEQELTEIKVQLQQSGIGTDLGGGAKFTQVSTTFPTFGLMEYGPYRIYGYWDINGNLKNGIAVGNVGAVEFRANLKNIESNLRYTRLLGNVGQFFGPIVALISGSSGKTRLIGASFIENDAFNGLAYGDGQVIEEINSEDNSEVRSDTGLPIFFARLENNNPIENLHFKFAKMSCEFSMKTFNFLDTGGCYLDANDNKTILIDKIDIREFVDEGIGNLSLFAPMATSFLKNYAQVGFEALDGL